MSNVLGIGIDNREILKFFSHIAKGERKAAWRHTKMGLPFIPGINPHGTQGSGIFPSGFFPAIETMQDVLSGEWEKWIPIQAKRMAEMGASLMEGQITTPMGKKGYPVRNLRTGELRDVQGLPALASRTFLAQPRSESEQRKALSMERMLEEAKREKISKIASAIVDKKALTINKLLNEKEDKVTGEEVEAAVIREMKRRQFTPLERKQYQLWLDKNKLQFRITGGEPARLE